MSGSTNIGASLREHQRGSTKEGVQVWSTKVGAQMREILVVGTTVNVVSSE